MGYGVATSLVFFTKSDYSFTCLLVLSYLLSGVISVVIVFKLIGLVSKSNRSSDCYLLLDLLAVSMLGASNTKRFRADSLLPKVVFGIDS